jgi:hypothetical protein
MTLLLFKGRVIFNQYTSKKHKRFGIRIYKLCDSKGLTYNMTVCLGKDKQHASPSVTATHPTVAEFTARLDNVRYQLYRDNILSSLALFGNLHNKTIKYCGTVRPKGKGMPKNFGQKMKLKTGDVRLK